MKKILAMLLAIIMCISMLPVSAFAEEETETAIEEVNTAVEDNQVEEATDIEPEEEISLQEDADPAEETVIENQEEDNLAEAKDFEDNVLETEEAVILDGSYDAGNIQSGAELQEALANGEKNITVTGTDVVLENYWDYGITSDVEIIVAEGAFLTFKNVFTEIKGSIIVNGTMYVDKSDLQFAKGTEANSVLTVNGLLSIYNYSAIKFYWCNLTVNGKITAEEETTFYNTANSSFNIADGGEIELYTSSKIENRGTVNIQSSATLRLDGSSLKNISERVANSGIVNVGGTLELSNNSDLQINSYSEVIIDGKAVVTESTIENNGTIDINSSAKLDLNISNMESGGDVCEININSVNGSDGELYLNGSYARFNNAGLNVYGMLRVDGSIVEFTEEATADISNEFVIENGANIYIYERCQFNVGGSAEISNNGIIWAYGSVDFGGKVKSGDEGSVRAQSYLVYQGDVTGIDAEDIEGYVETNSLQTVKGEFEQYRSNGGNNFIRCIRVFTTNLTLAGSVEIPAGCIIEVSDGGELFIAKNAYVHIAQYGNIYLSGSAKILNHGALSIAGGIDGDIGSKIISDYDDEDSQGLATSYIEIADTGYINDNIEIIKGDEDPSDFSEGAYVHNTEEFIAALEYKETAEIDTEEWGIVIAEGSNVNLGLQSNESGHYYQAEGSLYIEPDATLTIEDNVGIGFDKVQIDGGELNIWNQACLDANELILNNVGKTSVFENACLNVNNYLNLDGDSVISVEGNLNIYGSAELNNHSSIILFAGTFMGNGGSTVELNGGTEGNETGGIFAEGAAYIDNLNIMLNCNPDEMTLDIVKAVAGDNLWVEFNPEIWNRSDVEEKIPEGTTVYQFVYRSGLSDAADVYTNYGTTDIRLTASAATESGASYGWIVPSSDGITVTGQSAGEETVTFISGMGLVNPDVTVTIESGAILKLGYSFIAGENVEIVIEDGAKLYLDSFDVYNSTFAIENNGEIITSLSEDEFNEKVSNITGTESITYETNTDISQNEIWLRNRIENGEFTYLTEKIELHSDMENNAVLCIGEGGKITLSDGVTFTNNNIISIQTGTEDDQGLDAGNETATIINNGKIGVAGKLTLYYDEGDGNFNYVDNGVMLFEAALNDDSQIENVKWYTDYPQSKMVLQASLRHDDSSKEADTVALKDMIDTYSTAWYAVIIHPYDIVLNPVKNVTGDKAKNALTIPENVCILCESYSEEDVQKLTVGKGMYINNYGEIMTAETEFPDNVGITIAEGSHVNNCENGAVSGLKGTVEGYSNIESGSLTIKNATRVSGSDTGIDAEFATDGKYIWVFTDDNGSVERIKSNAKKQIEINENIPVTWSLADSSYSEIASVDAKGNVSFKNIVYTNYIAVTATAKSDPNLKATALVLVDPAPTSVSIQNIDGTVIGGKTAYECDFGRLRWAIADDEESRNNIYSGGQIEGTEDCYEAYNGGFIFSAYTLPNYSNESTKEGIKWTLSGIKGWENYLNLIVLDDENDKDFLQSDNPGGTIVLSLKDWGEKDDIIKALAGKKLTLTATVDGTKLKTAATLTFVNNPQYFEIESTYKADGNDIHDIRGGETLALKVDYGDQTSITNQQITWSLDEQSSLFATIDQKGNLKTKAVSEERDINVCARTSTDNERWYSVRLYPAATDVEANVEINGDSTKILNKGSISVNRSWNGTSYDDCHINIDSRVLPNGNNVNVKVDKVEIKSSAPSVITVENQNDWGYANLVALKAGKANITINYMAYDAKGKLSTVKSATVAITVTELKYVDDFSIKVGSTDYTDQGILSIETGKSVTVKIADVNPKKAIAKYVWEDNSDDKYVTLTPSADGTSCNITALAYTANDYEIKVYDEFTEKEHILTLNVVSGKTKLSVVDANECQTITGKTVSVEYNGQYSFCVLSYEDGDSVNVTGSATVTAKNSNLFSIFSDGNIVTLLPTGKEGTTEITCTYNGQSIKFKAVTNKALSSNIVISESAGKYVTGELKAIASKTLKLAAWNEDTGKASAVTWSISDTEDGDYSLSVDGASVNASGVLTVSKTLCERKYIYVKAELKAIPGIYVVEQVRLYPAASTLTTYVTVNGTDTVANGKTVNVEAFDRNSSNKLTTRISTSVNPAEAYQYINYTLPKGVSFIRDGGKTYLSFEKPGKYTVKVAAADGCKASTTVTFNVGNPVKSIDIAQCDEYDMVYVTTGKSLSLKTILNTYYPAATDKKFTYELDNSSDSMFVKLTADGKITAAKGIVNSRVYVGAHVTAQSNGIQKYFMIVVCPTATKIGIFDTEGNSISNQKIRYDMFSGEEFQIVTKVYPVSEYGNLDVCADQSVTYKSSISGITIDSDGIITISNPSAVEGKSIKITVTSVANPKLTTSFTFCPYAGQLT